MALDGVLCSQVEGLKVLELDEKRLDAFSW